MVHQNTHYIDTINKSEDEQHHQNAKFLFFSDDKSICGMPLTNVFIQKMSSKVAKNVPFDAFLMDM